MWNRTIFVAYSHDFPSGLFSEKYTKQLLWLCSQNSDKFRKNAMINKMVNFEKRWKIIESKINLSLLTDKEKIIHNLHLEAIQKSKFTYKDPETGYLVMTSLKHFLRGYCCGTGCRHCPYEHENVLPDTKKLRKFNTAFYIVLKQQEETS